MKLDFLPERQQEKNSRVTNALRFLTAALTVLLVAHLLSAIYLYSRGPMLPPTPQVIAPDGISVMGDAIFVAPNWVLCQGRVPAGSEVALGTHWRQPITPLRAESISD